MSQAAFIAAVQEFKPLDVYIKEKLGRDERLGVDQPAVPKTFEDVFTLWNECLHWIYWTRKNAQFIANKWLKENYGDVDLLTCLDEYLALLNSWTSNVQQRFTAFVSWRDLVRKFKADIQAAIATDLAQEIDEAQESGENEWELSTVALGLFPWPDKAPILVMCEGQEINHIWRLFLTYVTEVHYKCMDARTQAKDQDEIWQYISDFQDDLFEKQFALEKLFDGMKRKAGQIAPYVQVGNGRSLDRRLPEDMVAKAASFITGSEVGFDPELLEIMRAIQDSKRGWSAGGAGGTGGAGGRGTGGRGTGGAKRRKTDHTLVPAFGAMRF